MSRFWRHFISNGRASLVEKRLGLFGQTVPIGRLSVQRFELVRPLGVQVRFVQPDGPADQAGMMEEDVLVLLAEQPVTSLASLHRLLAGLPAGLPLPVVLLRGDRRLERWVILNDQRNLTRRP